MNKPKKEKPPVTDMVKPITLPEHNRLLALAMPLGSSRYIVAYKQALALRLSASVSGGKIIDPAVAQLHAERLSKPGRAGEGYRAALDGEEPDVPEHGNRGKSRPLDTKGNASVCFTLRTVPAQHQAVIDAANQLGGGTTPTDLYKRGAEELIQRLKDEGQIK